MAQRLEPINAIAYAQFCLRGGYKQTFGLMLAALLIIGLIEGLIFGNNVGRTADIARASASLLLGAQLLLLTAFGTLRINAAVRQDITSGLIESHRLTPMSPLAAIFGYVLGAPLQAMALGVVVFLAGLVMTVLGDRPVHFWLIANFVAFASALVLWSFTVLASFAVSQPGLVPLAGGLIFPAIGLVSVIPALGVLAAPLTGESLWTAQANGSLPVAYAFSLAGDALFAGIFLLGAARKFRSATNDAFNMRLALLTLFAWTSLTAIGTARPDLFNRFAGRNADTAARMLAALLSSTALAFLPTATAARASVVPLEMFTGNRAPWWRGVAWLVVPLCVLLVCSVTPLAASAAWTDLTQRQLASLASVGIVLTAVAFLIAWADLRGRAGWVGVVLWVMLGNLLPLLAEAVNDGSRPMRSNNAQSLVLYSPIGSLNSVWTEGTVVPWPALWTGIGVQAALLIIPVGLFANRWAAAGRRSKSDPAATSNPALTTLPPPAE